MTLRTRLLIALVGVAVVAVAAVTLTLRQATQTRVLAYYEDVLLDDSYDLIEEYYYRKDGFPQVGPLLKRIAMREDRRLILATEDGEVLADSDPTSPRPDLTSMIGDSAFDLADGRLAVLYVLDEVGDTREQQLRAGVDRLLLSVALGVVAAAMAVAVWLARRLTRPLVHLRDVTRRLGRGDTTARADADAPGEVGHLAHAFNQMAERLEASEKARRQMTADTAHELRTPIANLRAYIEGMVDGIATPDGDDLAVLHDEVVRLARLVDDLQQLALTDAGELRLDLTTVDLWDVAAHAAAAAGPRAEAAGVRVEIGPRPGPTPVAADTDRLVQVLANLVDNAVHHAPADSTVSVDVQAAGTHAEVSISDRGAGIPPDELARIFDRLHRLDPARSRNTGGAGLGLAIAAGLVEAHGGQLTVDSTVGVGTTFRVRLPAMVTSP